MTQPTHDEVIAWIDEAVFLLRQRIATTTTGDGTVQQLDEIIIASLLANRAGLERHKSQEHCKNPNCTGPVCSECGSKETVQIGFPCPTYTEIYDPIRSVM